MDKEWREEQLGKLSSGSSIFRYVPEHIGKIVYCNTNQPMEKPLSEAQKVYRKLRNYALAAVALVVFWWMIIRIMNYDEIGYLFLSCIIAFVIMMFLPKIFIKLKLRNKWMQCITIGYLALLFIVYLMSVSNSEILHWGSAVIVSIAIVGVAVLFSDTTFKGSDYFVGSEGFAILRFRGSRDNFVEQKVVLYKDLCYFLVKETVNKYNGKYVSTSYAFTIFGKTTSDSNPTSIVHEHDGIYKDEQPLDHMSPYGANDEYSAMRWVEREWTKYFLVRHAYDEVISFPVFKKRCANGLVERDVKVCGESIVIDGITYNCSNTKNYYFSNGELILLHESYSTKYMGFSHEGNRSVVKMGKLANRMAFMILFNRIFAPHNA